MNGKHNFQNIYLTNSAIHDKHHITDDRPIHIWYACVHSSSVKWSLFNTYWYSIGNNNSPFLSIKKNIVLHILIYIPILMYMVNIYSSRKTLLYCLCKFFANVIDINIHCLYHTEKNTNTKLHMSPFLDDNGS